MNVVDSSCWIEYLMGTEIGKVVAPAIENQTELIVPTIIVYEVYKKLAAERDDDYALSVILYMQGGTVVDIDTVLGVSAAQVSKKYGLAMADSLIYASCLRYGAVLWTADQHFKDMPDVNYFMKM